jgi:hypothetical protein
MNLNKSRACAGAVAATITLLLLGCGSLPTRAKFVSIPQKSSSVSRVVVLWSEGVLRQANLPVSQGFAAKVYLFGPDATEATTSQGKFKVYAYDDTNAANRDKPGAKPDRTWEVDLADLKELMKKDAIGWSYSLWLPFSPPADSERRCSLILCFVPDKGSPVISDSTLVTLPAVRSARPGATTKLASATSPKKNATAQVSLSDNLLTAAP